MSPTSNGVPEADVAEVLPVQEKVDRTITGKVLEPCDKVTGDVPEPSLNLITTGSEVDTVAIEVRAPFPIFNHIGHGFMNQFTQFIANLLICFT